MEKAWDVTAGHKSATNSSSCAVPEGFLEEVTPILNFENAQEGAWPVRGGGEYGMTQGLS